MLDPQEWHANAGDAVGTCGCSLALGPGQYWWVQFPELVEIVVEVDEVDIIDRSFNPSDDNVLIRKARDDGLKSQTSSYGFLITAFAFTTTATTTTSHATFNTTPCQTNSPEIPEPGPSLIRPALIAGFMTR